MTLMHKAYDGTEFDFDALPEASRRGMLARGYAHVMGNEVASIVVSHIRNAIAKAATPERKSSDVSTDEIKAFRTANPDQITAWNDAAQAEKHRQLLAGELGIRTAGTAVNPLDKLMLSIARQEVKALFKKQGWEFPSGDATFKAGDNEFTGDELVDRWLDGDDKTGTFGKAGEANAPRIERVAKRQLADRDKVKRTVAAADTSGLAASLGL